MAKINQRVKIALTLESVFPFGKHKDQQVEDVIEDDSNYIAWVCEEEIFDFDEETLELISRKKIA